jgi:hypothetical protein
MVHFLYWVFLLIAGLPQDAHRMLEPKWSGDMGRATRLAER